MFKEAAIFILFPVTLAFLHLLSSEESPNFLEIHQDIDSSSFQKDIITFINDLLNRTQPESVGFIVDSIYLEYIGSTSSDREILFTSVKDSQSFEDEPEDKVQAMLIAMKAVKCQLYVILITNGVQMKGFLKYVDYNRLLSFDASFVILHDYRLFTSDLFYLWKRLVNVIFIRKCETKDNWYELSTVPFPRKIEEIFISKIVNYWSPPKRLRWKQEKIFTSKSHISLNGETLKVLVLPHTPTVYKSTQSGGNVSYSGLEVDLLSTISSAMNFSVNFYESRDSSEEKWGRFLGKGNFTGLYGEMDTAKADIALGGLHYTNYHLNIMDLTIPYNVECLTFITPEVLNDNTWKTLISPFSLGMWIGVLLSLFGVGVFFFLFSSIYRFIKKGKNVRKRNFSYFSRDFFDDLSNCVLYTYSMILVVSLPRLPTRWSVRVLTGWWWIYCVLVVVAYRASLTSILANPQPKLVIDTLEVLASSNLKIGGWGEETRKFFMTSSDSDSQKIGARIEHVDDADDAIDRVSQGGFAYYESKLALQQLRHNYEVQKMEAENLHIMEECAINMSISIGLEKNSAIREQIDRYIKRAVEGGLIGKWLKSATMGLESSIEPPPPEALMDLRKFYGALFALACGYILALLSFISEKLYWKFVVEKHPNYDRYRKIIRIESSNNYSRLPRVNE